MAYCDLRRGRYSEINRPYFITARTIARQRWFAQFDLARLVIAEMRKLHDQGVVESWAWVVMPDHLHWLFALRSHRSLGEAINLLKGRSARSLNLRLRRTGPVWQPAYYDHALRAEEDIRDVARYIVANPLRAGLASSVAQYPHWDAAWLLPESP